jgi:phospholipid transport system substrate-binding protein
MKIPLLRAPGHSLSGKIMRIIKSTLPICAALVVNLLISHAVLAAQTDAGEFVKKLGNHAIRVLTVKDLTEVEREKRFRTLLRRGVKQVEIDEYNGLFEDLIVATYAARFAEYTGQEFVIKRVAKPKNRGDSIVMSEISPSNGGPSIRIDWQVHGKIDDYKIVDVRVEGVSMSVTQREEFTAVIRRNGGKVDALLGVLRKKTEGLKSKQSSN